MTRPVLHVFLDECDGCSWVVKRAAKRQTQYVIRIHSIWSGLGDDALRLSGREPGKSIIVFTEGRVLHGLKAVAAFLWLDRRFLAASMIGALGWLPGDGVYEFVSRCWTRGAALGAGQGVYVDCRFEDATQSAIDLLAETAGGVRGLVFRTLRSRIVWRSDAAAEALVSELEKVPAGDHKPKLFGFPWEIGLGFCNYKHPRV